MKSKFISESYFSDSQTDDTEEYSDIENGIPSSYMYQMMLDCDFIDNNSEVQKNRVRLIEQIIRKYENLLSQLRYVNDYERPWPTIENNYPSCYVFLKFDCNIRTAAELVAFIRNICTSFVWGTVRDIRVKDLRTEKSAFINDTTVFMRNFTPEHPKLIQPCQIYYIATIFFPQPLKVYDYVLRNVFRGNMPAFPSVCNMMGNDYNDVIMQIPGNFLDAVMLENPVSAEHLNELRIGAAAMDYTISADTWTGAQVSATQPKLNNFKNFRPNSTLKDIYDRIAEGDVLVRDIKIVYKPVYGILKIFMSCGLFLEKFRYQLEEFFLVMECESVSDTEDELCMLFGRTSGMLPGADEIEDFFKNNVNKRRNEDN